MESGTEIVNEPRFVVDEMMGKLSRWLRMAGLDVEHRRPFLDEEILDIARKDGRVIVTRDRKLVETATELGLVAWVVDEDIPFNQLVEVMKRGGIDVRAKAFTRCTLCNGLLADIAKEDVAGKVPPFIFATQTDYRYCAKCKKVYWPGTHRKHMEQILDDVARAAGRK